MMNIEQLQTEHQAMRKRLDEIEAQGNGALVGAVQQLCDEIRKHMQLVRELQVTPGYGTFDAEDLEERANNILLESDVRQARRHLPPGTIAFKQRRGDGWVGDPDLIDGYRDEKGNLLFVQGLEIVKLCMVEAHLRPAWGKARSGATERTQVGIRDVASEEIQLVLVKWEAAGSKYKRAVVDFVVPGRVFTYDARRPTSGMKDGRQVIVRKRYLEVRGNAERPTIHYTGIHVWDFTAKKLVAQERQLGRGEMDFYRPTNSKGLPEGPLMPAPKPYQVVKADAPPELEEVEA